MELPNARRLMVGVILYQSKEYNVRIPQQPAKFSRVSVN